MLLDNPTEVLAMFAKAAENIRSGTEAMKVRALSFSRLIIVPDDETATETAGPSADADDASAMGAMTLMGWPVSVDSLGESLSMDVFFAPMEFPIRTAGR